MRDSQSHLQDFQNSVRLALSRYRDFDGRSRRPEFWYFFLFAIVVNTIISMVIQFILPTSLAWLGAIAGLILLLPSVAVSIRRLHDIGKSGWFILLAFIPLIGSLALIYFYIQPSIDAEVPQPSAV